MSQRQIAIITDSTCDIPDNLIALHDIIMIPLYINWKSNDGMIQHQIRDRVELKADEFYHKLGTEIQFPSTSQPNPKDFLAAFQSARQAGAGEILVITIGSGMSGTYQSASVAADEYVGGDAIPVHLYDSCGPTMSLGWQVLAAARSRDAGASMPAILSLLETIRSRMAQWVTLDTMEYLHRGGRIGGATRLLGTLLNIKPLIYIDHTTGLVEAGDRARGRRKALDTLYNRFFEEVDGRRGEGKKLRVAILHGQSPDDAALIAGRIRQERNPDELLVSITSPVLGVHTGPGAISLCGYYE